VALTVLEALVFGFTPFDGLGCHVSGVLGFRRGVGTTRGELTPTLQTFWQNRLTADAPSADINHPDHSYCFVA